MFLLHFHYINIIVIVIDHSTYQKTFVFSAMFIHLMKTAEHWFSTYEHDSQKVHADKNKVLFELVEYEY